jgi:hypothetical protein
MSHHIAYEQTPMGKMIRIHKREGWQVWPTPFQFGVQGRKMFARLRFRGALAAHNRRRRPLPHS